MIIRIAVIKLIIRKTSLSPRQQTLYMTWN